MSSEVLVPWTYVLSVNEILRRCCQWTRFTERNVTAVHYLLHQPRPSSSYCPCKCRLSEQKFEFFWKVLMLCSVYYIYSFRKNERYHNVIMTKEMLFSDADWGIGIYQDTMLTLVFAKWSNGIRSIQPEGTCHRQGWKYYSVHQELENKFQLQIIDCCPLKGAGWHSINLRVLLSTNILYGYTLVMVVWYWVLIFNRYTHVERKHLHELLEPP